MASVAKAVHRAPRKSNIWTSIVGFVAKKFQANMRHRLDVYGLKYDDLLIETPEVETALTRIKPEVLVAREKRIKRAFDLSFKHTYLPSQYVEAGSDSYLQKHLKLAERTAHERKVLNHY